MVKVLFLQNYFYEYMGMMWLSAALKKAGHRTDVLIEHVDNDLVGTAVRSNADIIAFPTTTGVHKWVLDTAKQIKMRCNKLILVGGPHATFFPEIIENRYVDIVGMGECEEAIVELADAIRDGKDTTKIMNLWVKKDGRVHKNGIRPLVEDLGRLGSPDREIYYRKYSYMRNATRKGVFTGRGCPYNCTFCFNHSFKKLYADKGRYIRKRKIPDVIAELKDLKAKYPVKTIFFLDDTFVLDRRWGFDFLKVYKEEIALPFICHIRANPIDEEIIRALKEGGCVTVFFGVESGNEKIRNEILKKGVTDHEIVTTAGFLHKYGITFRTYNMIGLPGESVDNAFETVGINQKIKTDFPWCSVMQPYPRTEIYQTFVDMALISSQCSPDQIGQTFYFSKATSKTANEMENLQKLFIYAVKFPKLTPLIRRLVRWKPNFLFDVAFIISHGYMHVRSESLDLFQKGNLEYARNIIRSLTSNAS